MILIFAFVRGDSYKRHNDYFSTLDAEEVEQEGNRILTVFMYLNDVEEGGGTAFTELNFTVTPKLGRVVLWPSVLNEDPTEVDPLTYHAALPVEKGTKYGANVWFKLKPSTTAYMRPTCDDDEDDEDDDPDSDDKELEAEQEVMDDGHGDDGSADEL
jgi:2OG-Fe(II) oxygenase superfamily